MRTFSIDKKKQPLSILKFRYGLSFIITILSVFTIQAQKKVTPVTQSTITNIPLPAGSKLDKRTLSEVMGKALLQEEAKNLNTTVTGVEIIYLSNQSRFTADSLVKTLTANGWSVSVVENDHKYAVLKKNNQSVLAYFEIKSNEISLYFGQINSTQPETGGNNTVTTNPVTAPVSTTTTAAGPVQKNEQTTAPKQEPVHTTTNQSPVKDGFQFNTTPFDDGWISSAKENWTEVTKGSTKVLLHYPNQQVDAYHSVLKEGDMIAWNSLVAPKYNSIQNFQWRTIQSYESITFIEADAMEKSTGKNVHIILFKKHYTKGNGRYLEFITSNKAAFEQEFGPYHNDEFGWDKMANMQFRNKYAVSTNDLTGTWSANDYASLTYYYVNGGYAGATATSTADEFTFLAGNNYKSDHAGASGTVGNQQFSRQVYQGKFSVNNWEMALTNRFKGETEKYSCYFEAVKGGRILIMTDRLGTNYTLVKK